MKQPKFNIHSKHNYIIAIVVLSFLLVSAVAAILLLTRSSELSRETYNSLELLNQDIDNRVYYSDSVQTIIDSLSKGIESSSLDNREAYDKAKQLYLLSRLFSFEHAKSSVASMVKIATNMNDNNAIAEARTFQAYNYARAGFFHEALDSLAAISLEEVNDSVKSTYNTIIGRVYHDLADYTHDNQYTPYYNSKGNEYLQAALQFTNDTLSVYYLRGKILLKNKQLEEAKQLYLKALSVCPSTNPEMYTVLETTLAHIYRQTNENDKAISMYIEACGVDVRNGFRDVVSMRGLAEMMYNNYQDVDNSARYINLAVETAQAYGTRSRINSIGSLMPLYVGQKMQKDANTRYILIGLIVFVCLLLFLLVFVLAKYRSHNALLKQSNELLNEANKMKETYLGLFLDSQSELSLELNNFALVANQKLKLRQYDALKKLIDELERKHTKTEVLTSFDKVFITIFPTFVEEFNQLLLPENVMTPKKPGEIPSMMRIFALIRLGITDNNRIAHALNYSYNTVHNYRVRVRNMATDPQHFESNVTKIG